MGNTMSAAGPDAHEYQTAGALAAHQVPIVYDPAYNVTFGGLERIHPFDSCKYKKVCAALIGAGVLAEDAYVSPGAEVTHEVLSSVHTAEYLESLRSSMVLARVCEIPPIAIVPNAILQSRMLKPMRTAVRGTIVAGEIAARNGWAINLGGGMHHASSDNGGGWCVYSDIVLSFQNVVRLTANDAKPIARGLIIDLDVHQGNGLARDIETFHSDGSLYLLDMFGMNLWPCTTEDECEGDYTVGFSEFDDAQYLQALEEALDAVLTDEFPAPGIIFYNAGTDILEGDPLNHGEASVSREGVARRDMMVFSAAATRGIPIVMVLSGGYADESGPQGSSAQAVSHSLIGLLRHNNGQYLRQAGNDTAVTATVRTAPQPKQAAKRSTKMSETRMTYDDMAKAAILALKDRTGSSSGAITQWIKTELPESAYDPKFQTHRLTKALKRGVAEGTFVQARASYKLSKKKKKKKKATKTK